MRLALGSAARLLLLLLLFTHVIGEPFRRALSNKSAADAAKMALHKVADTTVDLAGRAARGFADTKSG